MTGLEHEDYVRHAEGDTHFDAAERRDQLFYDPLKQWYLLYTLYTRWIGEAVYDAPVMTKHNLRREHPRRTQEPVRRPARRR